MEPREYGVLAGNGGCVREGDGDDLTIEGKYLRGQKNLKTPMLHHPGRRQDGKLSMRVHLGGKAGGPKTVKMEPTKRNGGWC